MRRKKANPAADAPERDLLNHINGLGLATVEEYRDWCARHGFSRKLQKHWKQRCRERYFSQQSVARERLARRKREQRNHVDILRAVCEGELAEDDVTQSHLKRLCEAIRPKRGPQHERQVNRNALIRLVTHLNACRARLFDGSPVIASFGSLPGNTFVEAMALIAAHSSSWLRPVEDWKPRSHSSSRQFAALLRHLFARYDDVRPFLDSVWFCGRNREAAERRRWYLHVGRGQNIRHCRLPIAYTKRMAHHFMQAPDDVTVEQALRWGQVHGLGGDERLARALFGTLLTESFEHDDFWSTVIRWFVAHPMLDRTHVGPIVDYLFHQKFVPEHVYVAPGCHEESPPPQPNLSMKGRAPDGLLRRVHEWHRSLASDNLHQVRQWQPQGIEGFELLEGSRASGNLKCWTIRELLSSKALLAEGRKMKHCVATYAASCARGRSSIWTMEVESVEGRTKAVTIEVRNNARLICQVRGRANRFPNDKERQIIQRWACASGLRVASYI